MLTQQENENFKKLVFQSALPVGGHLIICAVRDVLKLVDLFTEENTINNREEIANGSNSVLNRSGNEAEGKTGEEEGKPMEERFEPESYIDNQQPKSEENPVSC